MSRSAFSEHFSKTFGRTAMEFVKEVRLRRAAELLLTTKRPIKAIAADVGYHSRSHFTQAFKEIHGLHPAAYREQRRQPSFTESSSPYPAVSGDGHPTALTT
jgi:AraC-like DNA-binding protein